MPLFKPRDFGIDIVLVGRGDLGSEAAKTLDAQVCLEQFHIPEGLRDLS
jgi:hypothetical protein